ncbi:hypothetical protein NUW54_g4674 [Trametes sanguinea]|uniref:Uncharacterized protein n=1 Tax=Trametes sanguinea TaxID=158606 RepID=A0ACC1PYI5_9APHY|nr:hypothetical protein NUW54_g4674 [Trametes sanguinea]
MTPQRELCRPTESGENKNKDMAAPTGAVSVVKSEKTDGANMFVAHRRPRALVVPGALTEADGVVTLEVPVSNTTRSLVTSCFCCAVTLPETIGPPRPDALGAWMPVPCGVVYRIDASSSNSLVTQRRKMRCDGQRPACNQCQKADRADDCEYMDGPGLTQNQMLENEVIELERRIHSISSNSAPLILHDPYAIWNAAQRSAQNNSDPMRALVQQFVQHATEFGFFLHIHRFLDKVFASGAAPSNSLRILLNVMYLVGAKLSNNPQVQAQEQAYLRRGRCRFRGCGVKRCGHQQVLCPAQPDKHRGAHCVSLSSFDSCSLSALQRLGGFNPASFHYGIVGQLGGRDWQLSAEDLNGAAFDDGTCLGNIIGLDLPSASNQWILGTNFLHGVYAAFSLDDMAVGFATPT